jgi:hypothetical protein
MLGQWKGLGLVFQRSLFIPGGNYHGLHYIFGKDGISFELQFHTQQSYEIKMGNHYDYEVWRNRYASRDVKDLTDGWMMKTWADFEVPYNYSTINNYP